MENPVRAKNNTNAQYGFTLLEIIIVLSIVAVLTGLTVAMFRFDRGEQYLDDSAREIVQLYRGVRDEAVLSASPRRLVLEASTRLIAEKREAQGSVDYIQDDAVTSILLKQENVTMHMTPKQPIFFFPSGQTTPFQLTLELETSEESFSRIVSGDAMGRVVVLTP